MRRNPEADILYEAGEVAAEAGVSPEQAIGEIVTVIPVGHPDEAVAVFLEGYGQANPGAFERCVREVEAKGSAYDPRAVCAAAGRRKYGQAEMTRRSIVGRRRHRGNQVPVPGLYDIGLLSQVGDQVQKRFVKARRNAAKKGGFRGWMDSLRNSLRNPADESDRAFESFHGFAPTETVVVEDQIHYHEHLWAVGDLEKVEVLSDRTGEIVTLSEFEGALLAANENRTQLYVRGGDQQVALKEFGIGQPYHDKEDLGEAVKVWYFTNKTHLGSEGGEAVYHHKLSEEKKLRLKDYEFGRLEGRKVPRPRLVYDVLNKQLEWVGGEYVIEPEGIRN